MKKKIILVVLGLFLLGGCCASISDKEDNKNDVRQEQQDKKDTNKNNTKNSNENNSKTKENNEDNIFVIPQELPYNMNILPPDSIGTVYGNLTFKNNSKYVIKSFNLTIEYTRDGKKDKTYYSSYDTIMPGETSPIIDSFISNDWKPIKLEYKIYNKENGKYRRLEYDYKLDDLKGTSWIKEK